MTQKEKLQIENLRKQGLGYTKIANIINLPINTVKSYCYRNPIQRNPLVCLNCSDTLKKIPHKKTKKFCSDKCRMMWWNNNKSKVKKKAFYNFECKYCGLEFQSYGNAKRKYCSRSCSSKMKAKEKK